MKLESVPELEDMKTPWGSFRHVAGEKELVLIAIHMYAFSHISKLEPLYNKNAYEFLGRYGKFGQLASKELQIIGRYGQITS